MMKALSSVSEFHICEENKIASTIISKTKGSKLLSLLKKFILSKL